MKTTDERFDAKWVPEPMSGCFLWLAYLNPAGYGKFKGAGREQVAHRFAYIRAKGPIPAGLEIDHLCNNRGCVNSDHLEAVTHTENMRRSGARQTHCKRGHERTAGSIDWNSSSCKVCKLHLQRARRAIQKQPQEGVIA